MPAASHAVIQLNKHGCKMPWMTWMRMFELTLPRGAYLRALRIAREADVKLIAVYWCGGNLPALSDKFIEAADSPRAEQAKCAFIVVGPAKHYSPRHGVTFNARDEGSNCVG